MIVPGDPPRLCCLEKIRQAEAGLKADARAAVAAQSKARAGAVEEPHGKAIQGYNALREARRPPPLRW